MFPAQEDPSQGGGNLEDRLRGLILNNATPNAVPTGGQPPPFGLPPTQVGQSGQQLPTVPVAIQPGNRAGADAGLNGLPSPPGRGKRPNQAQRRQMNAQMTIPVDSRPNPSMQNGRGTGYNASPSRFPFGNQNFDTRPPATQNQQHRTQQQSHFSSQHQNPPQYHTRQAFPHHPQQHSMKPYPPGPQPQVQSMQNGQFQQPNQAQYARPPPQNRQLYQPGPNHGQGGGRPYGTNPQELAGQSSHLQWLAERCVPDVGVGPEEEAEKEAFRAVVELACRQAITEHEQIGLGHEIFDPMTVELQCFGSMRSGFATKASDMDLALLTPKSVPAPDSPESVIPRILEKNLLDLGYGARLLTRTRVPIIKLCEKPTTKLLADLLAERQKWESGFVSDQEDEDDHHEPVAEASPEIEDNSKELGGLPSPPSTTVQPEQTRRSPYEIKLASLRQRDNQSLGDFFNNAKRLLKKLGGRDIAPSSAELNPEEAKIVNDVCKAFISGLASEALITRLCSYQSIMPLFNSELPYLQRSLHGVWTQIDGERLALAWDTRPLTERDDKLEFEAQAVVTAWRAIQDWHDPIVEPAIYNRQLYMASEKLKRVSSLQLVALEQIQHEDPIFYLERAQKILGALVSNDNQASSSIVMPIVVAHYIGGIGNKQIREIMQSLNLGGSNLRQAGLCHRALQLASDYEHALQLGKYDEDDKPDIERYIHILRSQTLDLRVAVQSEAEASLVAKMRSLPDPTLTSTNKPRDRYKDHLEFPKTDIGIQCDINFSAHLAIHNTQLLRCYSSSDPRVKTMILFVKHWAKVRGVNTPYRGTLSSYGYVLMVLHYLVNIAQPFVCPNLQSMNRNPPAYLPLAEIEARTTCQGQDVRFWRNETEIWSLAERRMLNHNHDSIGLLLRGFFEYYAQTGQMSTVHSKGFDWGREVLSLRTRGGLVSKQEKGWVGAKTVVETTTIAAPPTPSTSKAPVVNEEIPASPESNAAKPAKPHTKTVEETKEVRHRYLFAIEDPFELEHNVARTVTHNGIVSIRDEFRRAWRIIKAVGKPYETQDGGLLDPFVEKGSEKGGFQELLNQLHGVAPPKADGGKVDGGQPS